MPGNQQDASGRKVYELACGRLAYCFENGRVKAEGKWKFCRETGQLWQIVYFEGGKRTGSRYDRDGNVEYPEAFQEGRKVKK